MGRTFVSLLRTLQDQTDYNYEKLNYKVQTDVIFATLILQLYLLLLLLLLLILSI